MINFISHNEFTLLINTTLSPEGRLPLVSWFQTNIIIIYTLHFMLSPEFNKLIQNYFISLIHFHLFKKWYIFTLRIINWRKLLLCPEYTKYLFTAHHLLTSLHLFTLLINFNSWLLKKRTDVSCPEDWTQHDQDWRQ